MTRTKGENFFAVINYIILTVLSLLAVYPLIYVLSASISSSEAVLSGSVLLLPKHINFGAYSEVFKNQSIYMAYFNSFFYTIIGTMYSLLIDILAAYPLSKRRLMGRGTIGMFIAFSMWFSAGMIPFYLTLKTLHLLNSRMSLIIPFACTAFHIILLRAYFSSIPDSLEESAKIDGANDFTVLLKIFLPLSMPAIATIALYIAVGRWNAFFWAMILLKDDMKIPLQVLLRNMVVKMSVKVEAGDMGIAYSRETVVYATMMIAVIPMLVFYPFIQKHFVKGIMIGGIKG